MAEPDRSPSAVPVVTAAGATFCAVLTLLALQVRAGEDPAIGAGPLAQPRPQRQVVVRRIVERRVVRRRAPKAAVDGGGAAAPTSSPAPPAASPAPAAPAPAPPPAPVVSRAS